MKKIKYIGLSLVIAMGFASCEDWLEVNDNPNTPTQDVASLESRLPWIEHHYGYAAGTAGFRAGFINGTITSRKGVSTLATNLHNYMPYWDASNGISTTPYQHWFVGAACNLEDLIKKAEEEGAYHYIGVAHVIRAMGFMLMADWYGECPYTEALGAYLTPKYDTGQAIFEGCMADLDLALPYFDMTQEHNATPLKDGDSWNDGDVTKWKALVYGLKARWLNNLSKKSSLYKPEEILSAIEKGPKDYATSTIVNHVNDPGDTSSDALAGDPLKTSFLFDCAAWSDHIRMTKYYTDLFEYPQTDGSVVYDPRREKMLPMNEHYKNGESYFMVTSGVDIINSDILNNSGPAQQTYNASTKSYSVSTAGREGDTIYVTLKGVCCKQGGAADESYYQGADGTILSTGTFYTLPESPTHLMTSYEMDFIKAEVLFRQGDKGGALTAYKNAIKGHLDFMNTKLKAYGTANNPGKNPMPQADIDEFLASDCIAQTANELTMAEIMKQKFIAMSFSQQNWNDMRRFNFSAGNVGDFGVVYPGFDRPKSIRATAASQKFPGASKSDNNYWWRRMAHCSHEVDYNAKNLKESNAKATDNDIWSVSVWWDVPE